MEKNTATHKIATFVINYTCVYKNTSQFSMLNLIPVLSNSISQNSRVDDSADSTDQSSTILLYD